MEESKCWKLYKKYKDVCNKIDTFISCNSNQVRHMEMKELNEYLASIRKQFTNAQKCAKMRIEYRDSCVEEQYRDFGHERAIQIAEETSRLCERELDNIAKRFDELQRIHKEQAKQIEENLEHLQESTLIQPSVRRVQVQYKKRIPDNSNSSESSDSDDSVFDSFANLSVEPKAKDELQIIHDQINSKIVELHKKYNLKYDEDGEYVLHYIIGQNNVDKDNLDDMKQTLHFIENMTKLDLVKIRLRLKKTYLFAPKNTKDLNIIFINLQIGDIPEILPSAMTNNSTIGSFLRYMDKMITFLNVSANLQTTVYFEAWLNGVKLKESDVFGSVCKHECTIHIQLKVPKATKKSMNFDNDLIDTTVLHYSKYIHSNLGLQGQIG